MFWVMSRRRRITSQGSVGGLRYDDERRLSHTRLDLPGEAAMVGLRAVGAEAEVPGPELGDLGGLLQ